LIRLLAKIERISRKQKSYKKDRFEYEILSLTVTIKGPARKSFRLAPSIRGKRTTVQREFLKGWTPKKGDTIVLNVEESKKCIANLKKSVRERQWKNFILKDINGDGLHEYFYDNPYLTAGVIPHYGARLSHLFNKGTGNNELFGPNLYKNEGYIELSGFEESLSKRGKPDELWNAQYKRIRSQGKNSLSFVYKMKKMEGIEIQKDFLFFKEYPGLYLDITVRYKPERSRKRGKKKGKKQKIRLGQRCHFAMGGIPDYKNLFHVPQRDGMHTVRFNRPLFKRGWEEGIWWEWLNCFYAFDSGLVILEREDSTDILIQFFDREKVNFLWTGVHKATPRFQISFKERTVKPKKEKKFTTLLYPAHSYHYSDGNILFSSVAEPQRGTIPLTLTLYSKRKERVQHIGITKRGETKRFEMKERPMKGIPGHFYQYSTSAETGDSEITASVKNKNLHVRITSE
jgi:hypothetical protein